MSNIQPARGFRDFDPVGKRHKEQLLVKIKTIYSQYGFDEIETPVVEPLDRLRDSEGGENIGMIFQVLRRGLSQEELREAVNPSALCDLGLRYDLTVPLARFFASNQGKLPQVLRSIQVGPVWRAERPQKGRYRQFTQCDIDIIGDPSIFAEIELIIATLAALDAIGLKDSVVRINDRRFLDALLANSNVAEVDRPRALVVIDKLDKIGLEGVAESLSDFLSFEVVQSLVTVFRQWGSKNELNIDDFLKLIATPISDAAITNHRSVISAVRSIRGSRSIRFDPTLVRGLGYYTGPIFEIEHHSSKNSVAGGGRYDKMIGKFVGRDVPACGFSLGFDRLLEITKQEFQPTDNRIALIYSDDAEANKIFGRQQELIAMGYMVGLIRAASNKKRLFSELAANGYKQFQFLADSVSSMRKLS